MKRAEVAKAIEAIESNGKRPTTRAVRELLGRGNLTEIGRHINAVLGTTSATAEVAKLRRDLAERDRTIAERDRRIAELDAALATCGAWAADIYRRHVVAYPALHVPLPLQEPRLVTAERT